MKSLERSFKNGIYPCHFIVLNLSMSPQMPMFLIQTTQTIDCDIGLQYLRGKYVLQIHLP